MKLTARSTVEYIDPSLAPSIAHQITTDQRFQVAVVTIVVYDALITIDREARYFWKVPRKPVEFVYFLNRYSGMFGAAAYLSWNIFSADLTECNFAVWSQNVSNWLTIILVDYILMVRVLALYSQDRALSILLHILLALEAAFKLGLLIYLTILQHIAVGELAKGVIVCGSDGIPPVNWGIVEWTIPLVYGTILMGLALYKAADYWRLSAGFKGLTLVKVLMVDQVLYFALVILCCVLSIMEYKLWVSDLFLSNVLYFFGNPSLQCVLGSRMLFNLKEAGECGENEGTNYRAPSRTLSEIDFAEGANPAENQIGLASDEEDTVAGAITVV